MTTTLLGLDAELREIEAALMENGGELTPEIEAALEAVEGAIERKIEGVCWIAQELTRKAEAAKAESVRLSDLARVRENSAKRLKEYLRFRMERDDVRRYDLDRFRVSRCRNSRPAVEFAQQVDELPPEFQVVTFSPDTAKAYEALKSAGMLPSEPGRYEFEIAGATVVVSLGEHVRIS